MAQFKKSADILFTILYHLLAPQYINASLAFELDYKRYHSLPFFITFIDLVLRNSKKMIDHYDFSYMTKNSFNNINVFK